MPDLAATGTPLYAAGKFGDAFDPNGGAYLSTATATGTPLPAGSNGLGTIEAWVKYTGTTGTRRYAWSASETNPQYSFGIAANGKPLLSYGSFVYDFFSTAMPPNQWVHLAMSFAGGAVELYVNGVRGERVGGVGDQSAYFPTGHTVGRAHSKAAGGAWIGQVDEIRFSKVQRYTGTSFTVPSGPFVMDTDTISLYHLNGSGVDGDAASPPSYSGAAVVSGTGTLSTLSAPTASAGPALTGGGGLSADPVVIPRATAALSGDGTLTTAVAVSAPTIVALAGNGALATIAAPAPSAPAALSGAGNLTASTRPGAVGVAALSGTGALTAQSKPTGAAIVELAGSGALTGAGSGAGPGAATLSGSGALTTSSTPRGASTVALTGGGQLSGGSRTSMVVGPALSGSGTVATSGTPRFPSLIALAGVGALLVAATTRTPTAAVLTGDGILAAVGVMSGGGTGGYRDIAVTVSSSRNPLQATTRQHTLTVEASI